MEGFSAKTSRGTLIWPRVCRDLAISVSSILVQLSKFCRLDFVAPWQGTTNMQRSLKLRWLSRKYVALLFSTELHTRGQINWPHHKNPLKWVPNFAYKSLKFYGNWVYYTSIFSLWSPLQNASFKHVGTVIEKKIWMEMWKKMGRKLSFFDQIFTKGVDIFFSVYVPTLIFIFSSRGDQYKDFGIWLAWVSIKLTWKNPVHCKPGGAVGKLPCNNKHSFFFFFFF